MGDGADTPKKPLSSWTLAAFAAPAAPLLALTLPTIIFLPPHYAEHLGIPLATVSLIFLAARVLDFMIDPFIGGMQDRTESKWGRRRLWLALSCAPLMALTWLTFVGFSPGVHLAIVTVSVLVLYSVFATMFIAHLGWAGELIPTYHGRTRVLGAVQGASLIGQVAMLGLAAYVVQGLQGDNADAVHAMGWAVVVMLPLTTALAVFFVPEPITPPQPHLGLKGSIKAIIENNMLRRVLVPDLFLGIAQGTSGGLFLFYFQYVLGFAREAQTLLFIYFVAGLIGVPIWIWLGRKLGKHRALQTVFLYTAATTGLFLFVPENAFAMAALCMVIAGMGQGGGVLLTRSLMADVVDVDEVQTGARRSGVYFGLLLTTSKVGLAVGPLTYAALGAVGFQATLGTENSAEALGTLTALFIGVPVLLTILGALSLRNYPLDEKRQAALAAAISARQAENSANTLGPSTK